MSNGKVTDILSKTAISFDSDDEIAEVLGNALRCEVNRASGGWCVAELGDITPSTAGKLFIMQTQGRHFTSLADALTVALDIQAALLEIVGEELSLNPKPAE